MSLRLSRRTMLQGLGGACVGLPLLECMLSPRSQARAQVNGAPRRYAIVFAGQSLGGDGWPEDSYMLSGQRFTETGHHIVPAATGRGYTLTTPLEPLALLQGDFSIVSGLRIPYSATSIEAADVPPAGAARDFHGGASGPLLCATRSESPSYTCRSITSDQIIAGLNAGQTTLDSLIVRAQPSWYLAGSSYAGRNFISYSGPGEPIESQTSPQIVYRSLFSNFVPDDGDPVTSARRDFEQRARRSVLSLVSDKRERLLNRVGTADRVRLERHFDEIRALEQRILALPPDVGGQCVVPQDPGDDPPIGGDNAGLGSDSIGTNTGYSNEAERARLLADFIHMAFVCDLTRVATLQLTTFQSHMNVYPVTSALGTPIQADLHEVGHNGDSQNRGQLPVSLMLGWHVSHYAYLLDKLRNTPELDGTVLDNSAIIFMPEGGHGTQLNDATTPDQTHSVERMVLLVAGRAGGLNPGQHIATAGAHPGQVLISAMQATGYDADTFGEVAGGVSELFG